MIEARSLLPLFEHGGRLQMAAALYDIPRPRWVDLSTAINPQGWPVGTIPQEIWARLPEEDDGLVEVMRSHFAASAVLAVSGSQSAIQNLPRLRAPGRVAVRVPTYAEHAQAWQRAGHEVIPVDAHVGTADLDAVLDSVDVFVVVNPNNPTGESLPATQLLSWHDRISHHGGWLIVDEAFVDGDPGVSVASHAGKNLIVLRSLGKFWGLAGVRLGFVLAADELLANLQERLGPWHVSSPARWISRRALVDLSWIEKTRARLHQQRDRLDLLLRAQGLISAGDCSLFRWVPAPDVPYLFDAFARRGILIRAFPQFGGVRFGLPGPDHEWQALEATLRDIMTEARPRVLETSGP